MGSTMLIANNCTRESGNFMGDQLCSLKAAYLFVEHQPDVDKVIMSMSPGNEMNFLWEKFIRTHNVQVVWDNWNPGDWTSRWEAWDRWRTERSIEGHAFQHYRELYLRIHGAQRQNVICGGEWGLNRRNIYQYWYCGQEHCPEELPADVNWFDDTLIDHPVRDPQRDVYISPHCKTQGNLVFTFEFWSDVIHRLVDMGVSVTMGYDGWLCGDLEGHPNYRKHWGDHRQWMEQVSHHRLVACGNTGTGWLAAACGTPMITMEPHNSVMADHRYRECGLRNIVEMVDGHKLDELSNDMFRAAEYVADKIFNQVKRKVVMTTGCYDILHAGHVRHLEKARALGTKLIVALNSDRSVSELKGPERPINPQVQRRTVLEALRCVDEVRIFDGPDARHLIQEIKPDVLACGFGYDPDTIVGRDLVESWGGKAVVTCTGDAKNELSTTKIAGRLKTADIISVVREGVRHSINPYDKLLLMATEFASVSHLKGDIVDMGSYRGGSALILRRLAPDKHLHLFDTWEGNPYDEEDCHHKRGEWKASQDDCRAVVGDGPLITYWKGTFPSLSSAGNPFESPYLSGTLYSFVYVDMDCYQSTKNAIEFFWPRIVHGGRMVFDDYGWHACAGVKRAVDETFPISNKYVVRVTAAQYTFVVEKR